MSEHPTISRTLRQHVLLAFVALGGCYESTSVDLPPAQRLIFVDATSFPFDEDVIGMSASRDGLHVLVDRPTRSAYGGHVARYAMLGVSAEGATTYEKVYPDYALVSAPLSDASGRPSVVVGPVFEPFDFGGGTQAPNYIRGKAPTLLVSYDESGALRGTFEIGDANTGMVLVHDFDVAADGTIVVCGFSHLERRELFVRVFEADGASRALVRLGLPPITSPAQCAIDSEGAVLVYGAQADIDDPAADIRNPGLTLLDRDLEVLVPSIRFSDGGIEITADPRGFFIVQSSHVEPHLVDTTAYPMPSTSASNSVIATVSRSGAITHLHEVVSHGDDPEGVLSFGHIGRPNRDAQNSLVRFGYAGRIETASGPLDTSTSVASVLMVEFDDSGAFDRPFSLAYDSAALPEYAVTVGPRLWLVDARDRRLSIARYVWRRTLDR